MKSREVTLPRKAKTHDQVNKLLHPACHTRNMWHCSYSYRLAYYFEASIAKLPLACETETVGWADRPDTLSTWISDSAKLVGAKKIRASSFKLQGVYSMTCAKSIHIFFTFLSLATASTISRDTTIVSSTARPRLGSSAAAAA